MYYVILLSKGDNIVMKYNVKIIRDLRKINDLTQSQVAEYLGTSQTMYARYEREASELPRQTFIKAV